MNESSASVKPKAAAAPSDASATSAPRAAGEDVRRAEARVRQIEVDADTSRRIDGKIIVGLVTTIVLSVGIWWHTFYEMWHRWFPAWKRENMSFTDRLTEGDSYYTHGPLVPLACLVMVFLIYHRVGVPCFRTRGSRIAGSLLFAASILLQFVGARADVTFVSGFAMIGVLGSLIILWGGWPLARAYWLPVAFLVFMVPLPMSTIADINFQLKQIASDAALWLTNNVFGIMATREGSIVKLFPDTVDGEVQTLVVENVCSGLRSLISLICFASLFALVCRVKGWWRIIMLVLAPPVAVMTNVIRITTLNVSAHHWGVEVAGPGGIVHDTSGLAVFALALGILFGVEALIIKLGKVFKRDWSDPKIMGYLDVLSGFKSQSMSTLRPVPLVTMALIAVISSFWAMEAPSQNMTEQAVKAMTPSDPQDRENHQYTIGGVKYTYVDREMDELTRTILQTDDYLYRHYYESGRESNAVDLTIVFSANNRKGTHPPEVCLEGSGARVVQKVVHEVTFTGKEGARTIDMRELVTEKRGYNSYHLYTYKCGESYTPNFFTQQATIFFNGMVNRNTAGALIRVDVPVRGEDIASAREKAIKAAEVFMAQIDRDLP